MRSQSRASFSASTTVHPGNGGWIARALIPPSTWANAVSVTVVALSLAGQPLPCKYLPLFLHVGYNHTPAPEGAVLVAGKAGNVPALQAALEARGSTEEANDVRGRLAHHRMLGLSSGHAAIMHTDSPCDLQSGCTALYYTASRGHLEAFQILLAAGANPVAATKVKSGTGATLPFAQDLTSGMTSLDGTPTGCALCPTYPLPTRVTRLSTPYLL